VWTTNLIAVPNLEKIRSIPRGHGYRQQNDDNPSVVLQRAAGRQRRSLRTEKFAAQVIVDAGYLKAFAMKTFAGFRAYKPADPLTRNNTHLLIDFQVRS